MCDSYDDLQNFARNVREPLSRLLRSRNTDPSDMSFRATVLVKYLIRSSSVSKQFTKDARMSSKNLSYSTLSIGAPSNKVNGIRLRNMRMQYVKSAEDDVSRDFANAY
jgi:hypothetical protein